MLSAVNANAGFIGHEPNQKNISYPFDTDDLNNVADDTIEESRIEVPENFDGESTMEDLESIGWEDADYE